MTNFDSSAKDEKELRVGILSFNGVADRLFFSLSDLNRWLQNCRCMKRSKL